MSALGGVVQLKSIAIEERPMGRLHWSASPAKESVFGSLQDFLAGNERSGLNRISHPDWVKLSVELNCAPNQNTKFSPSLHRHNSNDDNVMKLTNSFLKVTINEVSCFTCDWKRHLAKICPNNPKKNKQWWSYCKSQTHKREPCRYKKRDTVKKAAIDDSSLVFKINDQQQKTVIRKGHVVDAGATSLIIKDISKFKTFDDSFQPDNPFIKLADGTKTKGVALKRCDTEICLVDMGGNHVTVSVKGALNIPSYP